MLVERDPGSFRDPNGFVFKHEGIHLRQVNHLYASNLDLVRSSGLEQELFEQGLLIESKEFTEIPLSEGTACFLRPEQIPLISYPYEWCFSQLKDAALLTLEIQQKSLARGMSLKDASAYNVQFLRGSPIFIDSLSFEPYKEGSPWVGYRQFCRHFLAPLALMSMVDVRLGLLSKQFIDGIPLDLASRLLPALSKLKPGLLLHLHAHAKSENHSAGTGTREVTVTKTAALALVDNLKSTIESLRWTPAGTEWGGYYGETNYSQSSMKAKEELVSKGIAMLDAPVESCWDLGANTGEFSRLAAKQGIFTVAWDIDPAAVEKNYLAVRSDNSGKLLPLVQDLTNPSGDLGWDLKERAGIISRGPAGLVLALALIHHLAIGNNIPLPMAASFFRELGKYLIIEFVPKEDSQVKRMLANREDIFPNYNLEGWRAAAEPWFEILAEWPVPGTERTLFVMKSL